MTAPAPHKLSNIQSLRGVAALLVVFMHLASIEAKNAGDQILPAFFRFGLSGVDLFFVISGFIMVYVTWVSPRAPKSSLKFLFARVTRIYPIYWLIATLVFVAWLIRPSFLNFDPVNTSIIKSFLLWPDQTLPMLKVAWTLIHELYFYIIFALILVLPRRFMMPALCMWILAVIVGERAGLGQISPETAVIVHPLSIEFFLGAVAGWVFKLSRGEFGWPVLLLGGIAWVTGLYFLTTSLGADAFPGNWTRVLYFGVPGVFIVYGLASIEAKGTQLPIWSSMLGDWSYSLYLSHILTLSALGIAWGRFAQPGPIDNILVLPVLVLASIGVAAVFWYMFEKPALTAFRALRIRLFPAEVSPVPSAK